MVGIMVVLLTTRHHKISIMNKETEHSNKAYPSRDQEQRQLKRTDEYDDTVEHAAVDKERAEQAEADPYKTLDQDNRPEDKKADKRFDEV